MSTKVAAASGSERAVRVTPPRALQLPMIHLEGFAPAPPRQRHPMRLRAHGVLSYASNKDLDEAVRGFQKNAYTEWYSAQDLVIERRVVKVAIESDLEVDCVSFGESFRELARFAVGGAVLVAWDDQVTSMRYAARSYGYEPIVPALPPAARARHGRAAERLHGAVVPGDQGTLAAPCASGVALLDEQGEVTDTLLCSAQRVLALDAEALIVIGQDGGTEQHAHWSVTRIDRKTKAIVASASAPATMSVTRATGGSGLRFFVFYNDNRAQLWDTTPRCVAAIALPKGTSIRDAVAADDGSFVALASYEGLFLWDPANDDTSQREQAGALSVAGAFYSVALLPSGDVAALGSTDPKSSSAIITRVTRTGAITGTTKIGKELELLVGAPEGVFGTYEYKDILISLGPSLERRWHLETAKHSGSRELNPSRDGRVVWMVSGARVLSGLDAETGLPITDHAAAVTAMAVQGELLATMDESGDLIVRTRRKGDVVLRHKLTLKAERSAHLVFCRDGLAVADSDRLVVVDVEGGVVRTHEKTKLTCAARRGDGALVTGHADGKVRLWESGGELVIEAGGDVRRIAVSNTGDRFACLFKDGIVSVFARDKEGGVTKVRAVKASRDVPLVALSPDGQTLVIARSKKERYAKRAEVLLVDVESGREHAVMERCKPHAALFSPSGEGLFVSDDRSVRLIALAPRDVGAARVTGSVVGHAAEVRALAAPDEGTLMSAAADQSTVEWDLAAVAAMGGGTPPEEMGIREV